MAVSAQQFLKIRQLEKRSFYWTPDSGSFIMYILKLSQSCDKL